MRPAWWLCTNHVAQKRVSLDGACFPFGKCSSALDKRGGSPRVSSRGADKGYRENHDTSTTSALPKVSPLVAHAVENPRLGCLYRLGFD